MDRPSHNDKIAPGPLRDFIADPDGRAQATVIVEAATGPLVDELPRVGFSGASSGKVKLRAPRPDDSDVVGELGTHIRELTGREPKWLKYADAYIVEDVTPEQVRQIASWPQTGMVRPNRSHHTRAV